ncbi:hypothetical protein ACEPAI_8509 [Sanghuangporus weigelae]
MPAISTPAKVLVTGANGFIAAWIVRALLEDGFSVRGTVREESKSTFLRNLFKDDVEKGNLEFVVVPNMADTGAFDDAVKGVNTIVHPASPVHLHADDPNEVIEPAVKGAVGVLESAFKYAGPQLKRVIFMSSTGAVVKAPYTGTFNEHSWNEGSIAEVAEKGRDVSPLIKYYASKTLAEKAVWDFVERNKHRLTWDLVATIPSYVLGPILSNARSPSELGSSMFSLYENMFSNTKSMEERASVQSEWTDVRDIAKAQLKALRTPEAGGQRFIMTSEPFTWLDWCDTVNGLKLPGINAPTSTEYKGLPYKLRFDCTKAQTVLGMELHHGRTESAKDIIDDFKERGFLK